MAPSISANKHAQISLGPRKSLQCSIRTDQCTDWRKTEGPINGRYKKSLPHSIRTDQCTGWQKLEAPINGRYKKSLPHSIRTDQSTGWRKTEAPTNGRYKKSLPRSITDQCTGWQKIEALIYGQYRKSLPRSISQYIWWRKIEALIYGRYRKRNHNRSDGGYRYRPHMPKAYSVLAKQLLGAGKSYFIREVSGISDIEVGDDLYPCKMFPCLRI